MWDDLMRCVETLLSGLLVALRSNYNMMNSTSQAAFGTSGASMGQVAMSSSYSSGASTGVSGPASNAYVSQPGYGTYSLQNGSSPDNSQNGQTQTALDNFAASSGLQISDQSGGAATLGTSNRTLVDLSSVLASLQALLNQQMVVGVLNSQNQVSAAGPGSGSLSAGSTDGTNTDGSTSLSGGGSSQTDSSGSGQFGASNGISGIYTVNGRVPLSTPNPPSSLNGGAGQAVVSGDSQNLVSSGVVNNDTAVLTGDISATSSDSSGSRPSYTGGIPRLTIARSSSPAGSGVNVVTRSLQGGCGIPNTVPGVHLNMARIMGEWYEYMSWTPGFDPVHNVFNVYTPLGYTKIRESSEWALAAVSNISMFVGRPLAESSQCIRILEQANFTNDGRQIALAYFPGETAPKNLVYRILFTDYTTMELVYYCNQANKATGICDVPYFWVNTRIDPRSLSQAVQRFVRTTVDSTLGPYCFNAKKLNFSMWKTAPPCSPSNAAPEALTSHVRILRTTVSANPSD